MQHLEIKKDRGGRSNDDLIWEMHGLVVSTSQQMKSLFEKLNNHISWDTAQHLEDKHAFLGIDDRFKPLESFRDRCAFAGRVITWVVLAVPSIGSIYYAVHELLKIFK